VYSKQGGQVDTQALGKTTASAEKDLAGGGVTDLATRILPWTDAAERERARQRINAETRAMMHSVAGLRAPEAQEHAAKPFDISATDMLNPNIVHSKLQSRAKFVQDMGALGQKHAKPVAEE
jgi:hypothetical protein